jgi:thioredoxin-related protein
MKILKFTAFDCNSSKTLTGAILGIRDQITYSIEEYDITKDADLASRYGITTTPALVLVDDNNTVVKQKIGSMATPELKSFLSL